MVSIAAQRAIGALGAFIHATQPVCWRDAFIGAFAWPAFWCLATVDGLFLAVHVLHMLEVQAFLGEAFNLQTDGGHSEVFQHLKELLIALTLASLAWQKRGVVHAYWAVVFAYLLVDDRFMIHETMGPRVSAALGLERYLQYPHDVGQVVYSAAVAGAIILAFALLLARTAASLRPFSLGLLGLVLVLGFFGVAVDLVHVMATNVGIRGLGILEEGGEMFVMSAMVAYVLRHALAVGRS